jgi:hypothetical protein
MYVIEAGFTGYDAVPQMAHRFPPRPVAGKITNHLHRVVHRPRRSGPQQRRWRGQLELAGRDF